MLTDAEFMIEDQKIISVPMSTYRTIDFRKDPSQCLYSNGITACVILLIKNYNAETKKYDNIVSMAHFFPNNAFDLPTAKSNILTVLMDYRKAGGELNKDTSIQVLCGAQLNNEKYENTAKAIIEESIIELKLHEKCKFKSHNESLIKTIKHHTTVYVNAHTTQITLSKKLGDNRPHAVTLLTNPHEKLSLLMATNIALGESSTHLKLDELWGDHILSRCDKEDGMPIVPVANAVTYYEKNKPETNNNYSLKVYKK